MEVGYRGGFWEVAVEIGFHAVEGAGREAVDWEAADVVWETGDGEFGFSSPHWVKGGGLATLKNNFILLYICNTRVPHLQ